MKPGLKHPETKIHNVVDELHGKKITDPYRWLEEDEKPVQSWIKKQNNYTQSVIRNFPVKSKLKKQLEKLYKNDAIGLPESRGNRYFFMERKADEDLSVLYVQEGLHGKPKVLIDQNKLSKDKTTVMKSLSTSWDGKLLAYSLSEASNDQASIYIMEVDTGKNLPDVIPGELYPGWGVTWKPDGSGFWYTHRRPDAPKGEDKYHQKLYFHILGTDFTEDQLIFGEELAKEDTPEAQISKDGKHLLITVYFSSTEKEKTEIYYKNLEDPNSTFIPVIKGIDALFYGSVYKDTILILTNHKAPKWKLMSLKVKDVQKGLKVWKTVIPEHQKNVLSSYLIVSENLFIETMEDVHSVFRVYTLDGSFIEEISLPSLGTMSGLSGEQDGEELFYGFSSYLTPYVIFRFNLKTKKSQVFKKTKIPFDEKLFTVKQVWYPSKDGTMIPMFLIHKKTLKLDGQNPTMIYGYGGFNINTTPGFDRSIIPFLKAGGVYVDTTLRGGGEYGEEWHKMGMKSNKQNVFDDFIYAAQYLIKNKYTNPNKLSIFGWSNGGLLVGAAITQRPDLYKAAVIGAPVLDMLRFQLFHGGRHWIQEYGSAENKSELTYLLKYSPYHNVKEGEKYPAVLILTTDKDDRVHPMHAFKMAAKLQKANGSDNPILLRIETQAGHSGAASVNKSLEQNADMWSFIYWQLGIKD